MSAEPIYGTADIADMLGVTRAAVSNHLRRHSDTPPATYVTTDGRRYWSAAGAQRWHDWHVAHRLDISVS